MPQIAVGVPVASGNTGKARVIEVVAQCLDDDPDVLDVGIAGPQPLEFWRPILDTFPLRLSGIDHDDGIRRTRAVAEREGWNVTLRVGTGYAIPFGSDAFDMVTATQVLEHVARPREFFAEIARVLRSGGDFLMTCDSAHYCARYPLTQPKRLVGNIVKRVLAAFGNERHYDLPWSDRAVRGFGVGAGFRLLEMGYYCLAPVKPFQNRLSEPRRSEVGAHWYALERAMNDAPLARHHASSFRVLFAHFKKV